MFNKVKIVAFAAVSLASLGLCSVASAQGIYLGPGGVGVDTGVRFDGDRDRDHRRDREFRRGRDHERGYGYDRPHFRDHRGYDSGYARHRRHRDDYEQ